MRSKLFALFCAALLLLTGCAPKPKDDFADYEWVEPPAVEGVTMRTEFAEYDRNLKDLRVIVTNDSDEEFKYDSRTFYLNKKVGDQWKPIKIIGFHYLIDLGKHVSPHSIEEIRLREIEDHFKLPLQPGHYRIWIGTREQVSAEFDVK